MMEKGPCEYCMVKSPPFMGPPEIEVQTYLCSSCLKLLRNPATALPLIRGNLTMKMNGKIPEDRLKRMLNSYMSKISEFKPRN